MDYPSLRHLVIPNWVIRNSERGILRVRLGGVDMDVQSWRAVLAGVACSVALTGCGSSGATAPQTPSPPSTLVGSAPAELQGVWVTVLGGTGDRVTLTLNANRYEISRPPNAASGAIAVQGDQIQFSQSTVCNGIGTYTWSVRGSTLSFTVASEGCPGRGEVLIGQTYTRSS